MLADFQVEKKEVKHNDNRFEVRGLSFNDLTRLLMEDPTSMENAFAILEKVKSQDGADDIAASEAAMELLREVPDFCARVIAYAADEPDAYGNVFNLPFPVQMDALIAVGELTFTEPDSVKKFLANLQKVTRGMTNLKIVAS